MTTDCSFFMKIVSSEYLQNMLCTQIVVFVLFWHSEQFWYTTCSADVASFWKRFTCDSSISTVFTKHSWNPNISFFLSSFPQFFVVQRFLALNIAPVIWTPSENGIPVFIAQIRTKAMMFFAVEQNFTNIVAQKRTKLFNPKFKSKSAFLSFDI